MVNTLKTIKKSPVCLINGIAADFLSIDDRSIHYGDGLFETVLCDDRRIYYWSQHFSRLKESADRLNIDCPDEQTLLDDIRMLLADTAESCVIKIILSRGSSGRGYLYEKGISANRVVMRSAVDRLHSSLLSKKLLSGDLFLCQQQVSINRNLAGIKHLNRLENVMARNELNIKTKGRAQPFADGLMLNDNGHVIEGTMSNLFAVKDGVLLTPDLSVSGICGIMRQRILALAAELHIETIIKDITLDELKNMDELFICNSVIGIKSIDNFESVNLDKPGISSVVFNAILEHRETGFRILC